MQLDRLQNELNAVEEELKSKRAAERTLLDGIREATEVTGGRGHRGSGRTPTIVDNNGSSKNGSDNSGSGHAGGGHQGLGQGVVSGGGGRGPHIRIARSGSVMIT